MQTTNPKDAIDTLCAEHDEALRHLETLRVASRAMVNDGATPAALREIERAVGFLDKEIRTHNQWEEDHLFPRLEAMMGPGGPCMVMRAEHRQLWDMYGTLGPLLEAARAGGADRERLGQLASVASGIVDLLTQHIGKENNILFPMARQILSPEDLRTLAVERAAH